MGSDANNLRVFRNISPLPEGTNHQFVPSFAQEERNTRNVSKNDKVASEEIKIDKADEKQEEPFGDPDQSENPYAEGSY